MNSKFDIQNSKLWLTAVAMLFAMVCGCTQAVAQGKAQAAAQGKAKAATESSTPKVDTVLVNLNAPKVKGMVEPDSIGIGDRFLYSIEVEKDLMQAIYFPNFGGEGAEAYELIEDRAIDTLERDGRRLKLRKSFLLAAFEEGIHRVVPQVMYADKNVIDTVRSTDTLDLLVTTFVIDSTSHSIFDLKTQHNLPFKFKEITGYIKWTLIALLVLALLIYAAIRIMRHYGKNFGDLFKPAPPLPPHVVAFAALEKLRSERLWQEEKHKLYYSTLTDILRSYIAGRYEVGAMEMTSDEIIEAMRRVELPQKSAMDLTQILRDADLVKFAKAVPEADENEAAYRAAWDFIEQTKPEEPTEQDDDDAEPQAASKSKESVKPQNQQDK